MRPTDFSTSPLTMTPKSSKLHVLTSGQSANRLDNLSCVRISEWKYIIEVTYVLVATTSFYLNRWRCQYGGVESNLKKSKCRSQYQDLLCYLSHDFNSEDHDITRIIMNFIGLNINRVNWKIKLLSKLVLIKSKKFFFYIKIKSR